MSEGRFVHYWTDWGLSVNTRGIDYLVCMGCANEQTSLCLIRAILLRKSPKTYANVPFELRFRGNEQYYPRLGQARVE